MRRGPRRQGAPLTFAGPARSLTARNENHSYKGRGRAGAGAGGRGRAGRGPAAGASRELEGLLRGRGLRLTGARRLVLEVVRSTDAHPTAEWVHPMVGRRRPRVSLGTVYRNLRLSLQGRGR